MIFNNSSNRIKVVGFILTDIVSVSPFAIEFDIAVSRKAKRGEESVNDIFRVYSNENSIISFARSHLKKGTVVCVKGELRTFGEEKKTVKICSSDIAISSSAK